MGYHFFTKRKVLTGFPWESLSVILTLEEKRSATKKLPFNEPVLYPFLLPSIIRNFPNLKSLSKGIFNYKLNKAPLFPLQITHSYHNGRTATRKFMTKDQPQFDIWNLNKFLSFFVLSKPITIMAKYKKNILKGKNKNEITNSN